jgi:LysM repeat protein
MISRAELQRLANRKKVALALILRRNAHVSNKIYQGYTEEA